MKCSQILGGFFFSSEKKMCNSSVAGEETPKMLGEELEGGGEDRGSNPGLVFWGLIWR